MSEMIVKFHHDERGIARSWDEVGKLVRCKDCRYWARNTQFCGVFSSLNIAQRMPEDGFCSYGRLRGDSDGREKI